MTMKTPTRALGLDYGEKRIGIALSDPLRVIAQPLGVLERKSDVKDLPALAAIARENSVDVIVMGFPLNLDGSEGNSAAKVRRFSEKLGEVAGIRVVLVDERLSTLEASRTMKTAGLDWRQRRSVVDSVSAALVLQSYLDRNGRSAQ